MHLSTLHPHADSTLVARALNHNAALRERSFAIVQTSGEAPRTLVLEADPRDRGLRLIANAGVGAEVTVRVPEGDYVGRVSHVREISALRGALGNSLAPMAWTCLAAAGFINAIPALGGDLGVLGLSLAATFEGVRRLAGYFQRLCGSDMAGAVIAAATASSQKGAQVQTVQMAAPEAPAALPAPEAPALVIPPLSTREMLLVRP